jgi:hypothetical protein
MKTVANNFIFVAPFHNKNKFHILIKIFYRNRFVSK